MGAKSSLIFLGSRKFIFFAAIATLLIFLGILVGLETRSALTRVVKLFPMVESLPPITFAPKTQHFDWSFLVETSLSASIFSPTMKLALILTILIILMFSLRFIYQKRAFFQNYDWTIHTTLIVFAAYNVFYYVRDLPDEAYVWASKVDSLISSGRLGVELFDKTFGESSVGTLQFVIASLLKVSFNLTVEQALLLPVLFSYLCAISFSYLLLRIARKSVFISLSFCLILIFSSKLIINVVNAFDNVLAMSLILFWIALEKRLIFPSRLQTLRLIIAVLGPLIRIDLLFLSIILFSLSLVERQRDASSSKHKVATAFWAMKAEIIVALGFAISWIFYKLWAFNELFPAMLRFKSLTLDGFYILEGTKYVINSIGKMPSVVLVFIVFFALVRFFGSRTPFFFAFSLFVLTQLISSVFSGGDYFGPLLARYIFPSLVGGLFALFLFSDFRSKSFFRSSQGWLSMITAVALSASLVFPLPQNHPYLERVSFASNSLGRVSCDNMAATTLMRYLESQGKSNLVVMTAEVNNAAFHMKAKLLDSMGLVDGRRISSRPNPYSLGNTLRKYRLDFSDSVIRRADILWLYGSAACEDTDIRGFVTKYKDWAVEKKFFDLLNTHQSLYRYDIERFFKLGFVPVNLTFSYEIQGVSGKRKGEIFALVRM